jgi:putative oxidoreductase
MSVRTLVQRAADLGIRLAGHLQFLAPLLTRITLGHAFFLTGKGKLANIEDLVGFMAARGIPFPELNAAFVARLEFYGGILLVLGLLTRLVAAGLASTMVVALLGERGEFSESWRWSGELGPTDIPSFVFLVLLSWLVLFGPGALSLDKLVSRWLRVGAPVVQRPPTRTETVTRTEPAAPAAS